MNVGYVAKALVAALIAFVGPLLTATIDGSGISLHEWLIAALAFLVALGGTYAVPNSPKRGRVAPGRAKKTT